MFTYVEDCTFIIRHQYELLRVLDTIKGVKQIMGLTLNVAKTQFMPLSETHPFHGYHNLAVSSQIKILGISWQRNLKQTATSNATRLAHAVE